MRLFTKAEWAILISLFALSFIPVFGGLLRILEISGGPAIVPENPRVTANPLPTVIHILSACIFCIFGALQFLSSIHRHAPKWHRVNGGIVASAGIISAISGLWMTHFYPLPIELQGNLLYFVRIIVGAAMVVFVFLGLAAIRNKHVSLHYSSMIRAYAIGQGASTQSLLGLAWIVLLRQEPIGLTRDLMMTAAWIINIVVAEWIIRKLNEGPKRRQAKRRVIGKPRTNSTVTEPTVHAGA